MLYTVGSVVQGIGLGLAASNRQSGDKGLLVAGTVLAGAQTVLFGVSAGQGMRRAQDCRQAKREFYRDVTQKLSELERESADSSTSSTSESDQASSNREEESPDQDAGAGDGASDNSAEKRPGRYVGIARAAEYCGVSKEEVWDAMQSDELEVVSTPTGQRIPRSSLEAYCSEENREE
jgi:hypothetical protein